MAEFLWILIIDCLHDPFPSLQSPLSKSNPSLHQFHLQSFIQHQHEDSHRRLRVPLDGSLLLRP